MLTRLRTRLEQLRAWRIGDLPAGEVAFSIYAIAAAFTTYFCMYAFRKPFAAAGYEGSVGPLELKTALVLAQIVGYTLSKFAGIKVVTELGRERRARFLLGLVAVAELALVLFAVLPPAGKVIALFFNGLPLGMVWGLTFSFLEGRKSSEILGAGLSTSYIVASGVVKSVGKSLMSSGVPEEWMPALVGGLFAPLFILAVLLLAGLPVPDDVDEEQRTHRQPMAGQDRASFFRRFAPGLIALTAIYMLLTAYREVRDSFQAELFAEVGVTDDTAFAAAEVRVAFVVMLALGLIFLIRDNRRAFFVIHGVMALGVLLIAVATAMLRAGALDGMTWMVALGTGLYLAYVPYGCVLFDRLIAATKSLGTSVFMIYVTDAFGYLGSIGVYLYKNFFARDEAWLDFFAGFSYLTTAVCLLGFGVSVVYFRGWFTRGEAPAATADP